MDEANRARDAMDQEIDEGRGPADRPAEKAPTKEQMLEMARRLESYDLETLDDTVDAVVFMLRALAQAEPNAAAQERHGESNQSASERGTDASKHGDRDDGLSAKEASGSVAPVAAAPAEIPGLAQYQKLLRESTGLQPIPSNEILGLISTVPAASAPAEPVAELLQRAHEVEYVGRCDCGKQVRLRADVPLLAPPDLAAEIERLREFVKLESSQTRLDWFQGCRSAEAERDAARVKALEAAAAIADKVVSFWPHGSGRHELAADIAATIRALKDKP